jgi:hypothetical protein
MKFSEKAAKKEDSSNLFNVCPPGFTGDRCEESLAACPDGENTCLKGAQCFIDPEAETGVLCASPLSDKGKILVLTLIAWEGGGLRGWRKRGMGIIGIN